MAEEGVGSRVVDDPHLVVTWTVDAGYMSSVFQTAVWKAKHEGRKASMSLNDLVRKAAVDLPVTATDLRRVLLNVIAAEG